MDSDTLTPKTINQRLREWVNQPLVIRGRRVEKRLFLSPMAGLGHIAFREIVASYGGFGLLFMEMCSAKALPYENRNHSPIFRWRDSEKRSLVCQIFGNSPDAMALAAMRIEQEGFWGVDVNMGCSVAAICKKNCGAALLKTPELALKIIEAIRKAVSIPLLVKFRTGWQDDPAPAIRLAKSFEAAGVDALTFHPRVAPDRRSRPPKWPYIRLIKEAVNIPVFGNGNVFDALDCYTMLKETGCDGVSIGRMAVARPWIFACLANRFTPNSDTYLNCIHQMADKIYDYNPPERAIKLFKKNALYFSANFKFGHHIYKQLSSFNDLPELHERIEMIFKTNPQITKRPNMNMFI